MKYYDHVVVLLIIIIIIIVSLPEQKLAPSNAFKNTEIRMIDHEFYATFYIFCISFQFPTNNSKKGEELNYIKQKYSISVFHSRIHSTRLRFT